MLTFAIFPLLLFCASAVLVCGLPVAVELAEYYKHRGRQSVVCPDNGEAVDVEVDRAYVARTSFKGEEHMRLESCSRWPEKGGCGQECLAQVEATPENVDRMLSKWYEGKNCAICARALSPSDWLRSRLAVLNQEQKLFELRHLQLDQLQRVLKDMHPLCWNCHQEERVRQTKPHRALKGERQAAAVLEN